MKISLFKACSMLCYSFTQCKIYMSLQKMVTGLHTSAFFSTFQRTKKLVRSRNSVVANVSIRMLQIYVCIMTDTVKNPPVYHPTGISFIESKLIKVKLILLRCETQTAESDNILYPTKSIDHLDLHIHIITHSCIYPYL